MAQTQTTIASVARRLRGSILSQMSLVTTQCGHGGRAIATTPGTPTDSSPDPAWLIVDLRRSICDANCRADVRAAMRAHCDRRQQALADLGLTDQPLRSHAPALAERSDLGPPPRPFAPVAEGG